MATDACPAPEALRAAVIALRGQVIECAALLELAQRRLDEYDALSMQPSSAGAGPSTLVKRQRSQRICPIRVLKAEVRKAKCLLQSQNTMLQEVEACVARSFTASVP
eukprot:scaffold67392_cov32-Tisochrysis_lutea.AAC.1